MYSLEPPRRGNSYEYPQSMFLSRNKKNNVYPCKPQFYYIKVGFKGFKIISVCFRDGNCFSDLYKLSFPTDRFKAVTPLLFHFVCASVGSLVSFILPLFVPHLSFCWCLWRDVLFSCYISREFHILLINRPSY